MLLNLYVKNLALIEEADISFEKGLNILTGETGAGKSIIIGSVNIALGERVSREIIRKGADYAYVELLFLVADEEKKQALASLDVFPDEHGQIIISRKILPGRTVSKINDESVTTGKIKQITSLFIDIHGQHEHQSLLYKSSHLSILDEYCKNETASIKSLISKDYDEYKDLQKKLQEYSLDEDGRKREMDFLAFELEEIENAAIDAGEEEKLADLYKKYNNSRRLTEGMGYIHECLTGESGSNASELISSALKYIQPLLALDEGLTKINDQLYDLDSILSGVSREVSDYMDELAFDEEEFYQTETRLDYIRGIMAKYGDSYEKLEAARQSRSVRLDELRNYQEIKLDLEKKQAKVGQSLEKNCEKLSRLRQQAAKLLAAKIRQSLLELNFLQVEFEIHFARLAEYSRNGWDEVEFLISTNPGEALMPLGKVASGGELSRIMLSIKTVLADSDKIPTVIFDEVDAGISGRTAQMVSGKLAQIGRTHQIICITHLPQIAAMADCHFEIKKDSLANKTTTFINKLNEEQMIYELARLLGGAQITETTLKSAGEMKYLAKREKDC